MLTIIIILWDSLTKVQTLLTIIIILWDLADYHNYHVRPCWWPWLSCWTLLTIIILLWDSLTKVQTLLTIKIILWDLADHHNYPFRPCLPAWLPHETLLTIIVILWDSLTEVQTLQAGGGSAVKFSVDFVICTHRIVRIVISSSSSCPGHHDGIFFNGFWCWMSWPRSIFFNHSSSHHRLPGQCSPSHVSPRAQRTPVNTQVCFYLSLVRCAIN